LAGEATDDMNVLVLDTFAHVYAERLRREFPALGVHTARTAAEIALPLQEVDVLITFGHMINDDLIARASRLGWIQSLATGVDHFLRCPELKAQTLLSSGRGIHGPPMQESVAYLMLALARNAPRLAQRQMAHQWDRGRPWPLLSGKTAAVVGVGVAGAAIGNLLKAFGMRLIGVSRTPRVIEGFDEAAHTDDLAAVAAHADYLVGILPSTPANARVFDARVFAAMKATAFFVNAGRGETVDEPALIECLRAGRIAGAGLDVFQTEPLPPESPLWDLPNVIVTPHIGGYFAEYEQHVLPIVVDNMRAFLAGRHDAMQNLIPH
jgi:phosphoglycerate dehydrogenase-like enzyme